MTNLYLIEIILLHEPGSFYNNGLKLSALYDTVCLSVLKLKYKRGLRECVALMLKRGNTGKEADKGGEIYGCVLILWLGYCHAQEGLGFDASEG